MGGGESGDGWEGERVGIGGVGGRGESGDR